MDDELPIIFKNGAISHSYPKNDNIPNYIDINGKRQNNVNYSYFFEQLRKFLILY